MRTTIRQLTLALALTGCVSDPERDRTPPTPTPTPTPAPEPDGDADGFSTLAGDCDDADASVSPAAEEVACNGLDDDCDAATVDTLDLDLDGFDACTDDCDDADSLVYPGAIEACDAVDNDCDDEIDGTAACGTCTAFVATGVTYVGCPELSDWPGARAECVALGGALAAFGSVEEQEEATATFLALVRDDSYWIGFDDRAVEGSFQWTDGTPVTFTSWNAGEPNNQGTAEDCVEVYYDIFDAAGNHTWNDHDCATVEFPFLCEL